jgi:hypothetical protein
MWVHLFTIPEEKVAVTRVVDRRRSVELHQTPVVHVPNLAPGHSQVAGHGHGHVQRVDLGPRAGPSLDQGLDPGQKVVHNLDQGVVHVLGQGVAHGRGQGVAHVLGQGVAHGLDQGVGHGQEVGHGRDPRVGHGHDPRVGHTLGVDQGLGRVHHALGLDRRVGRGVADLLILDQGNE